jgi:hypothetical protein
MAVEMPCWSERYTKKELFELIDPTKPYFRYVNFPVEVTEEIRILANEDDKTTI